MPGSTFAANGGFIAVFGTPPPATSASERIFTVFQPLSVYINMENKVTANELNKLNEQIETITTENEDTLKNMYLTFRLGNEDYGIEIRYVTEIVGMQKITEVPDMPQFVKGVVNLRGQVIPVLDMRIRFHMEARPYDERTCIVVVNIIGAQVGLVVDTVNEVRNIDDELISPPPRDSAQYIQGMGKVGEEVIILLEGQRLLFEHEVAAFS